MIPIGCTLAHCCFRPIGPVEWGSPRYGTSWVFFLEERGRQTTRILVRNRVDYEPRFLMGPFARLVAIPLHFVMQRKQLILLGVLLDAA